MLQVSSGFKSKILGRQAFEDIFNGGAILIFSGTRPGTADDAYPDAPVAMITQRGLPWTAIAGVNGINFKTYGPYVELDVGRQAQMTIFSAASARWFRLLAPNDSNNPSFTECRIDGDIGLKGSGSPQELQLDSLDIDPNTTIPFNSFLYTIPPLLGA